MQWENNWKITDEYIENGAQGESFAVINKNGDKGFLKIIKDEISTERRKRFFIEILLLKILNIEGVPKIYEDNSSQTSQTDEKLYYISEFVEGLRLDKYVKNNTISEGKNITLFNDLLFILKKLHEAEPVPVIHRDIKPENIIVSDSGKVHLVDFGIANFKAESKLTKSGQEIGNRFLRLPELSSGALHKRDPRSDLTLACGIALYMFTKKYPRLLIDENGNMPHQNEVAQEAISATKYKDVWNLIFDKAFRYKMADRWESADQIIEVLNIMKQSDEKGISYCERILKERAKTINIGNLESIKFSLINMQEEFKHSVKTIVNNYNSFLRFEEMGWVYNLGDTEKKDELRIYVIGDRSSKHLSLLLATYLLGNQLISKLSINMDTVEIQRENIDTTAYSFIPEKIKGAVLPKIVDLISTQKV